MRINIVEVVKGFIINVKKIGNSSSESTDIRLSDRACKFYESEGSEKNGKK